MSHHYETETPTKGVREQTHPCLQKPKTNKNIIFYSPLWEAWALKIIHSTLFMDPVFILIIFCPYCGTDFKDEVTQN